MTVALQRDRLGIRDEQAFWKWMRAAFAHKRKTLVNNWKGFRSAERLHTALKQIGVSAQTRAEALTLEQLAMLYRTLSEDRAMNSALPPGTGAGV
jgi:16S rRNA (adenine1518-N6/adenine1519-N6)-dimethyltransferase